MAGYTNLRNTLIRHLVASGLRNFKVLASCCMTDCISTANTATRLDALRTATAQDGIHFTAGWPQAHGCTQYEIHSGNEYKLNQVAESLARLLVRL